MQQQSSPLGPEVGWGVGLVGFAATAVLGWFMDAGVGFMLVLLVFWGGIGALFAFLVDRSTIEEHDRVDELQNTRLGTLGVAPAPPVVAAPAPAVRDAPPAGSADAATAGPSASPPDAVRSPETPTSPGASPRPARPERRSPATVAPSPRAYREQREAEERRRHPEDADDPRPPSAPRRSPVVATSRDGERRPGTPRPAGPGPEARPTSAPRPGVPPVEHRPRSPREYREAKAEAERRRDHHAAA